MDYVNKKEKLFDDSKKGCWNDEKSWKNKYDEWIREPILSIK